MALYTFLSCIEKALALLALSSERRALLSKTDDAFEDASVVLDERVKLDEIVECAYDADDVDDAET